jgi:hypothetical protein
MRLLDRRARPPGRELALGPRAKMEAMRRDGLRRRQLLAGAAATLAGACRTLEPAPELRGGWELALGTFDVRARPTWLALTVKPPRAMGHQHNLRFGEDELRGSAFGGLVALRIEREAVVGHLGSRRVRLDLQRERGQLDLWGTWGNASLDLVATDDLLRIRGACCGDFEFVRAAPTPEEAGFVVFQHERSYALARHRLLLQEPLVARLSAVELTLLVLLMMFPGPGGIDGARV